jgi:hypothetical protein
VPFLLRAGYGDQPSVHAWMRHPATMCWNPSFQDLPDATSWKRNRSTCDAAGRVFLACLLPVRRVLFLELLAPFRASHQTP